MWQIESPVKTHQLDHYDETIRGGALRDTPQRRHVYDLLLHKRDHPTATEVFMRAKKSMPSISLATVYNTLHQFTDVGLLRQVAVDGSKTYFDTNASDHHHFFVEGANELVDIPGAEMAVDSMPEIPEGFEIARVDVVVRLRRKG